MSSSLPLLSSPELLLLPLPPASCAPSRSTCTGTRTRQQRAHAALSNSLDMQPTLELQVLYHSMLVATSNVSGSHTQDSAPSPVPGVSPTAPQRETHHLPLAGCCTICLPLPDTLQHTRIIAAAGFIQLHQLPGNLGSMCQQATVCEEWQEQGVCCALRVGAGASCVLCWWGA